MAARCPINAVKLKSGVSISDVGPAAFLVRGERAVRRWQAELPSTEVLFDAAVFANLNRPEDLSKS
jgi:hypothetical protein